MSPTVLITGANGQIGSILTRKLRDRYGADRVIATDIRPAPGEGGRFALLDVTDADSLREIVRRERVTHVYHMVAILSASGEKDPLRTWRINMDAWLNVLEVARTEGVERVFYPSSIAVFGSKANLDLAPNDSVLQPATVYGISKAAGENWAKYYFDRYGLDVRSLRYPGVIGPASDPGGGTTDYAVDIYHYAARGEDYTCFLGPDATLPMIYMDDAIRATFELMDAPAERIRERTSYNLAGCSFAPREVAAAIREHVPGFAVTYDPDHRQQIAAGWPQRIDDAAAREDWGWEPAYDLPRITADMLERLRARYADAATTPRYSPGVR